MSALDKQVGGSHYKQFKIQPREFIEANKVPHGEASAIEYLLRHEFKNGSQDLLKAIENIQLTLEFRYGVKTELAVIEEPKCCGANEEGMPCVDCPREPKA